MSEERKSAEIIKFPFKDFNPPAQGNAALADDESLVDSQAIESLPDPDEDIQESENTAEERVEPTENEVIDVASLAEAQNSEEVSTIPETQATEVADETASADVANPAESQVVLGKIADGLAGFELARADHFKALEKMSANLAMNIAKKLIGEVAGDYQTNIANFFKANIGNLLGESSVIVKVAPTIADTIENQLREIVKASNFMGELVVKEDDSLQHDDCHIDWQSGGIAQSSIALQKQIDGLIAKYEVKIEPEADPEILHEVEPSNPENDNGEVAQPEGAMLEQSETEEAAAGEADVVEQNEVLQNEASSVDIGDENKDAGAAQEEAAAESNATDNEEDAVNE